MPNLLIIDQFNLSHQHDENSRSRIIERENHKSEWSEESSEWSEESIGTKTKITSKQVDFTKKGIYSKKTNLPSVPEKLRSRNKTPIKKNAK